MNMLVIAMGMAAALLHLASAKMVWNPITTSVGDQRHQPRTSTFVTIDDNVIGTQYRILQRGGNVIDGVTFGGYVNKFGSPITTPQTNPPTSVSQGTDYVSMMNLGTSNSEGNILFSITHFESSQPATAYLSKIIQNPTDGSLKVVKNSIVDFAAWNGLWNPCAGSTTPWQSHLGSEESDPNARSYLPANVATWKTASVVRAFLSYMGVDITTTASDADALANFYPYKYGFVWEATVNPVTEVASVVKHYAMGRFGVEMAYTLPDRKTVYINIDGSYKPHFMFVADVAGDLSAGCLYVARMTQTDFSASNIGPKFTIAWIKMGCATDAEIFALTTLSFGDIFETASHTSFTCPAGFTFVNTGAGGAECLKIKPGMEKAAMYLESTRSAGLVGGTTEWNKWEGMTYDTKRNRLYFSITSVTGAMLNNGVAGIAADGTRNDVRLASNTCGCVMYMDLNSADAEYPYWATTLGGLFCGAPNANYVAPVGTIVTNSAQDLDLNRNNNCNVDMLASPDNMAYVPGHDGLLVGEDTSGHQNDILWYYDLQDASLTRIFSTPYGSEVTGNSYFEDINGWAYMINVVQKPYGDSSTKATEAAFTGFGAYVGYIGMNLESGLASGLPKSGDICGPKGLASPMCDDGDSCTVDTCERTSYYDFLARCKSTPGGCKTCSVDGDCADAGDACTAVVCSNGKCSTTPVEACESCVAASDCDDGDACTTDSCSNLACVHTAVEGCKSCLAVADCDDGSRCTVDQCIGGACLNTPLGVLSTGCQSCSTAAECADGNPCTFDLCFNSKCVTRYNVNCYTCAAATECPDKQCFTKACTLGKCTYAKIRKCVIA